MFIVRPNELGNVPFVCFEIFQMINSAPALCPEENKNWSPRNWRAVIGWLGWKARHLTTISRVRCETRLISPMSEPIAKKFWLEAICSISWPRFISWEFDHFSSLKLRNHQHGKFEQDKVAISNSRSTRRTKFRLLV